MSVLKHRHFSDVEELINSGDENLQKYKDAFEAQNNRPSTITDTQLINIIASYLDDAYEDSIARVVAAMEATEKNSDLQINPENNELEAA